MQAPATFKGGSLSKAVLMNSQGIEAAIDDGILNVPFQVKLPGRLLRLHGECHAGVSTATASQAGREQSPPIEGNYFYISGVRAVGPDGTEREIAVMEVKLQ